jgi:hypothetical protein
MQIETNIIPSINTTGAVSGVGPPYLSEAPQFAPGFLLKKFLFNQIKNKNIRMIWKNYSELVTPNGPFLAILWRDHVTYDEMLIISVVLEQHS